MNNKISKIQGIGVDLDLFRVKEDASPISKTYDFAYFGRFLEHKGVLEIIEASKILKDVYKNYKPYVLTGKKQMSHSKNNFSLEKMNIDFATMINKYIIKKEEVQLSLPPLPKLQKV